MQVPKAIPINHYLSSEPVLYLINTTLTWRRVFPNVTQRWPLLGSYRFETELPRRFLYTKAAVVRLLAPGPNTHVEKE